MRTLLFFLACSICPGPKPPDVPADWKPLLGEYASGQDTIQVFERDGKLMPAIATFRRGMVQIGGKTYSKLPDPAAHIDPVRPVSELLSEALAATPPTESGDFREPELVEIVRLDPTIKLDIRYATSNNFMGTPFYS